MLGAESERGDPTRLGLLAASINVELDIGGTGPDAFTLGVPEVEEMEPHRTLEYYSERDSAI